MQKVHLYNRICMQAKSQFLKEKTLGQSPQPTQIMACPGRCVTQNTGQDAPINNPPPVAFG